MNSSQYRFQGGNQISSIPSLSGLYAWYYKPLIFDIETLSQTIISFFDDEPLIESQINFRYGIKLKSKSSLKILHGSKGKLISELLPEAFQSSGDLIMDFFQSDLVSCFTKPIYIGIAKNFYTRVYEQHYLSLDRMWNDDSKISKYLAVHPNVSVQEVIDELNLKHSFALEARVRQIAPRDLMVNIFSTDRIPRGIDEDEDEYESSDRRTLEQLLQVIADPICGRQ